MAIRKTILCLIGIILFATNPIRDLWFYKSIADHEGFGTIGDSYVIGVARQLFATTIFLPIAIALIVYGIAAASTFRFYPRFDRFTWPWGIFATLLAIIMIDIESDYTFLCLPLSAPLDDRTNLFALRRLHLPLGVCSISHKKILSDPANDTCRLPDTPPTAAAH